MSDLYLGIDLGGTFVKLGISTEKGEVKGSMSIPTRPDLGPENTVQRIGEAADVLQKKFGKVRACCSGVPGPLDLPRRILMKANNLPGWNNVRFPQMLGNRLAMPTYMENDANCAAWGEYVAGAGRGSRSLVLYTLGTGVGGGIILDGDMWVGSSGAAGALGHMVIDPSGPLCPCGQKGCVEQYASASAVAVKFGQGSAKDCFDAARNGNKDAVSVVDWSVEGLSRGVASVIQVLYPDVVVLAGGMALAGEFLIEKVRVSVKKKVYDVFEDKVRVEASQLPGDDAGWLGAALWGARKFESREIREPTSSPA